MHKTHLALAVLFSLLVAEVAFATGGPQALVLWGVAYVLLSGGLYLASVKTTGFLSSFFFGLWVATLVYAGLIVGSMLINALKSPAKDSSDKEKPKAAIETTFVS